jgi:hypothetical protein
VINEQAVTVAELWDGTNLKCTFWMLCIISLAELVQVASTIIFTGGKDELIWQYTTDGVYLSKRNNCI